MSLANIFLMIGQGESGNGTGLYILIGLLLLIFFIFLLLPKTKATSFKSVAQNEPMEKKVWYYVINDEQKGPITQDELNLLVNHNVIKYETLVWRQGLSDWIKLSEINSLSNSEKTSTKQTFNTNSTNPIAETDERKTDPFAIITLAAALGSWVFLPIIFVPVGWLSAIVSYYRLKENPNLKGKGIRLAGAIILIPAMIYLFYILNH